MFARVREERGGQEEGGKRGRRSVNPEMGSGKRYLAGISGKERKKKKKGLTRSYFTPLCTPRLTLIKSARREEGRDLPLQRDRLSVRKFVCTVVLEKKKKRGEKKQQSENTETSDLSSNC